MKMITIALVAFAALATGCSGSSNSGVATIEDVPLVGSDAQADAVAEDVDVEDAILAFAACMRDNGVEEFEDPAFNADGSIEFRSGGPGGTADRETLQAAREVCREHLEGVALGRGGGDRTEIEDRLYEFAACMRDNGYDMPDPDFSGTPGQGGGSGPFGELDRDDQAFVTALEACQETFGGNLRFGGGQGRPPGGSPQG